MKFPDPPFVQVCDGAGSSSPGPSVGLCGLCRRSFGLKDWKGYIADTVMSVMSVLGVFFLLNTDMVFSKRKDISMTQWLKVCYFGGDPNVAPQSTDIFFRLFMHL